MAAGGGRNGGNGGQGHGRGREAERLQDTRTHAELQPIVRVGSERNSASGFGGRAGRRGKSDERFQRRAGSGVMENRKSFPDAVSRPLIHPPGSRPAEGTGPVGFGLPLPSRRSRSSASEPIPIFHTISKSSPSDFSANVKP
jgi:hypothetical protein